MSVPDEKSRLRRQIKTQRSGIPENERRFASLALSQRLWIFLQQQSAQSVAVYLATPAEISLDPLIEILLEARLQVSAPRVDRHSKAMAFFALPSLAEVQIGSWNLREPLGDRQVTPSWVLVPGLAFDTRGHRLGMGAGWYDRTLTPTLKTIGVGYDWQIIPDVPIEDHDHSMNWIFSDRRQMGPF